MQNIGAGVRRFAHGAEYVQGIANNSLWRHSHLQQTMCTEIHKSRATGRHATTYCSGA